MNDCPRHYTQKSGNIGQFPPVLRKNPLREFYFGELEKMNDCPQHYTTQKKAAYQSVLPGAYVINRSGGFQIVECALFMRMRRERLIHHLQKHANSIYYRNGVGLIKRSASGILQVAISFKPASVSFAFNFRVR